MRLFFRTTSLTRSATIALFIAGLVYVQPIAQAQTFRVLYSFTGGADGEEPDGGLMLDAAGNLYGTTVQGGDSGCFGGTCGVVFELSPGARGWSGATLHTFTGGSDGGNPLDSLIFDATGNLYGTAQVGGVGECSPYGCGVAFELTPNPSGWNESVLYTFGADGGSPDAGLTSDGRGHFYSTLPSGQVYELIKGRVGWKEKTLYTFVCSVTNRQGSEPPAAPVFDAAGNLYGTASFCGSSGDDGTVFELQHGSWKEKTLYEFTGLDGSNPFAGLIFDKAGNLYGTTRGGGKYGLGTVFKLAPAAGGKWKETVLHSFKGRTTDGATPYSTLVFDKPGNLYGTTSHGGGAGFGYGTVFKLTPVSGGRWTEQVLHRFTGGRDGKIPDVGSLAIDPAGNLYGMTTGGGNSNCFGGYGCGVIFEITP